jgi:hypothetical protein
VRPGTPNGQLIVSSYNVLSHETFETITDPDGTARWNFSGNQSLFGQEIGDRVRFLGIRLFRKQPVDLFRSQPRTLNGIRYAVQPEYNNPAHAFTARP